MNILCKVDQAAALKRGINAPQSTVHIDVDPADLTQAERDVLAEILRDGHDATKGSYSPYGREHGDGRAVLMPALTDPSIDGLRDALGHVIRTARQYAAEYVAEKARRRAEADQEIRDILDSYQSHDDDQEIITVRLRSNGSLINGNYKPWVVERKAVVTRIPSTDTRYASPDLASAYEAAKELAKAYRQEQIEAVAADMREHEYAEWLDEQQRIQDEYDALYARLPETLRQRHADGYAADAEIKRAIRRLIRQDAGYDGFPGWGNSSRLTALTDDEYKNLQSIEAEAPEGATVTPYEVWDYTSRPAEDDEIEDADADGEVRERTNIRRVAVIEWSRGGVETKAVEPLA